MPELSNGLHDVKMCLVLNPKVTSVSVIRLMTCNKLTAGMWNEYQCCLDLILIIRCCLLLVLTLLCYLYQYLLT